jgi:hypothetical protein
MIWRSDDVFRSRAKKMIPPSPTRVSLCRTVWSDRQKRNSFFSGHSLPILISNHSTRNSFLKMTKRKMLVCEKSGEYSIIQ